MEANTSTMVVLNGTNYQKWKGKMKDLLFVKNMHLPIFAKIKPEKKNDEEWDFENEQVCGFIRQWVGDNVLNHVVNETNAKTLWNKLETLYASRTGNNKLFLLKQAMHLTYKENKSVLDHLNEFQGCFDQLSSMGINFEEEVLSLWLLNTLPESWETFRVTLASAAPKGGMTMELVKSGILNEEMRRRTQGATSNMEAFVAENRGRSQKRSDDRNNKGRSRSKSKSKYKDLVCHFCGKTGHIKKYCFKWKKENKVSNYMKDKKNVNDNIDSVNVASSNDLLVVCTSYNEVNISSHETTWVLDSGASHHVTSRRDFFSSYTPGDYGVVKMGNDGFAKVVGTGTICLQTNTGFKLILHQVRHVPDIRLDLISTGTLDDEGYNHASQNGKWKICKGSLIVAKANKCCHNGLYLLQASVSTNFVNAVENQDVSKLWHKRLSHISEKGLDFLAKKNVLPGLKDVKLDTCDHCLAGKAKRVSFKHSSLRQKGILELVHSDVCGPLKVRSMGGALYFVTFIDDHSRKLWVRMLKSKDQVFDVFKEFHVFVERETGKKLKCIRSDNGGEYCGSFDAYCREQGIKHQRTPPKTPQLNGLAERMNRTLVERVRCLLSDARLPKSFWGEALNTVAHIINLSPTTALQGDVPNRVWYGKDVSYDYLRVFGCKCFVHIPKDERSKLDAKSKQCIFIGYGQDDFGYRCYDPVGKKLIRSRDVVFIEDQTIEDIDKAERSSTSSDGDLVDIDPIPMMDDDTQESASQQEEQHEDVGEPLIVDDASNDVVLPETGLERGEQLPLQEVANQPLRRSTRERRSSTRYPSSEYVLLTNEGEPESFHDVQTLKDKDSWVEAMHEEINSLKKNNTFELVELPKGRRALKNKWVFKLKRGDDNFIKYKARLVVKGYGQKKGIDFDEIFSLVVKLSSIRVVLGLVASLNLELEQLDVKTAFLHGDLDEEIYMEQPEGFKEKGKEHLVCRLKKSLYGLKQAPRQWYKKFDSFMVNQGYKRTNADHCVYVKQFEDGNFIILLLYVDDMLIVGQDLNMINRLKVELSKTFDMKDLGPSKHILGMQITRDRESKKLWLSQETYIERILERFNMQYSKPVSTPLATHFKLSRKCCPITEEERDEMSSIPYASAVGSLMYAMVSTRPDIAHAVGTVSRYLSNPGKSHWNAVKWILRYLRGTSKLCICFGGSKPILEGFTDADMAGDLDGRKSTSGFLFTFAGGAISWQSKLQKCVALSTTEAEYIAATEAGKEMLWMKRFLLELGLSQLTYVVFCDSQSAMDLSKNSMYHSRTKHIDVRYHWLRLAIEEQMLQLDKVHTDDNVADMLTKVVPREKLELCAKLAGMEMN